MVNGVHQLTLVWTKKKLVRKKFVERYCTLLNGCVYVCVCVCVCVYGGPHSSEPGGVEGREGG